MKCIPVCVTGSDSCHANWSDAGVGVGDLFGAATLGESGSRRLATETITLIPCGMGRLCITVFPFMLEDVEESAK